MDAFKFIKWLQIINLITSQLIVECWIILFDLTASEIYIKENFFIFKLDLGSCTNPFAWVCVENIFLTFNVLIVSWDLSFFKTTLLFIFILLTNNSNLVNWFIFLYSYVCIIYIIQHWYDSNTNTQPHPINTL